MSPFLLKNTKYDVFAKLFCPALSEILKTETKIVATGAEVFKLILMLLCQCYCVRINMLHIWAYVVFTKNVKFKMVDTDVEC